jgi:O-antigen/teichoic acid export membrane protein
MKLNLIRSFGSKIGIDKAIIFTSATNIFGALGSVVSIILVVKYLSGFEQGFYYTFGSIVAIQIFFELGLNGIITQYVAHEVSNLVWENNKNLSGESKFKSRLSSLLHFSINWYLFFAIILMVTLIAVGFIFFNKYDHTNGSVIWKAPWILLAIGTVINLILSPIVAFIQGLGKVKEIAQIQFIAMILRLSIVWGGLVLGAKLYVLGLGSIISALIITIIIIKTYRKLLYNIWETTIIEKVNYKTEIFPFQWKIALSWMSGYFIFQLFNPVLFATEGPEVAGQMGMTLAALNGILSLSLAWITTKIPLFSGLIAQKGYVKLNNIFDKTLKQSVLINFSGLAFLMLIIYLVRYFNIEISCKPLGKRFLNYIPMFLMMVPIFLNQFVASWATYLRCHKKEPFLVNSLVGGILCALSTVILGKYFGVMGITIGYCSLSIMMFPWGYYIFKTKKSEWHE